jgi:hypothetical protein
MSYQDIASSWDNIRFDVPTQERRQYELSQSLLPQGTTSKQASIEAQYAAQRGTIVSSSGTLRPSAEGYRYSSGELFAVTPTGPAAAQAAISGPSLPSPAQLPSAGVGMIGLIAREKLGMDYISGGNAMTSALQANKAPGVSGPIIPTETKLAIRNVALTLPGIRTVWSAGEYIGLDYLLGVKTSEYNKQYSALESQGLISGSEFRGSEAQYNSLNAKYQQIESLQKLQGVALDRTLGINVAEAQAGERWKVPGTQFEPATAAYDFGHGLTTQLSGGWKGIQGGIGKTFEPVAPVAVTMVAGGMMMAGMSPRVIPHTLSFVKGFGQGVAATPEFIGMAMVGAEGLVKHPQAIPGAAILGGYIQAKGIYEGVTTRPVEFAGEMYGTSLAMGYAGRGISKATGFGVGIIDIPTGRVQRSTSYESGRAVTTERPITTSMAGLYWRNPLERPLLGRTETLSARPLVGVAWGESLGRPAPFVGRYVLPENVPVGTGYLPVTPADWAFARMTMETRLGGMGDPMRHIWDETFATRRVAHSMRGGTAPELAEPWGRVAPQTIPEPAWGEVAQYIRANRQDMVVYGSTTGRAFMGEYGRVTLGDLDIDIRPSRAQEHSQNIYNIVRRHQPNIGELRHETSMITGDAGRYTARMPSGEIVLDLHPYWEAKWDTPRSGLAESGGVRMMPLSRTVWGKTMFFLQYREVAPGRAIIEPYSGRFKDPADISLIMGKYSRDVLGKPLRWDINRIRAGGRLQLAQDAARISQSFDTYVRRYAKEGIPLLEEGRPALRGLDFETPNIADIDIRIGAITEFQRTDLFSEEFRPIRYGVQEYPQVLSTVPSLWKAPPLTTGTSAVKYSTTAARYLDTYTKTVSPGGKYQSPSPSGKYSAGYPSPAHLNKYLGYPPAKYPGVSKYGGIQRYLSGTRYPLVQRYPGGTKYPGIPQIPVYPGYPVTGKPPGYPTTNYPGRPTPPTTTTYPGITPVTTQYPGLTTKTASQLYPATTTTTRRQPPAPPEFPPPWRPPFTPPPTITIPRRWLTLTEEKPKKKQGIRMAPDVLASAWNLESPIPRIRQAFGYNIGIPLAKSQRRNELAISNIQKSRIPTRYVWKMPFEQIRRINVPKVI